MPAPSPFWRPDVHADRRPFLLARARCLAAVRAYFEAQGFIEVDCGALVSSPGAETHVAAFAAGEQFLHTSPEFAMKKLLAAGEQKIFYLGKVYRRGEQGPLHAPEFTMLEWYRARAPYQILMADCQALARACAEAAQTGVLSWRGRSCDPFQSPHRLPVADAFADIGADLRALPVSANESWSDAFSKILVERVEPRLGQGQLTFLDRYPIQEAALAQACPDDASCAERFEMYACGVELANGYGELTDPDEQRRRLNAAMAEKQRLYGELWPIDEEFLDALALMPPASGCALGFDRLIALACGARSLRDVLWSP